MKSKDENGQEKFCIKRHAVLIIASHFVREQLKIKPVSTKIFTGTHLKMSYQNSPSLLRVILANPTSEKEKKLFDFFPTQ